MTVVMCDMLGMDLSAVRHALNSFAGIERRLERVRDANGITIVDDYAHNPAKIRAGWQALASGHTVVSSASGGLTDLVRWRR